MYITESRRTEGFYVLDNQLYSLFSLMRAICSRKQHNCIYSTWNCLLFLFPIQANVLHFPIEQSADSTGENSQQSELQFVLCWVVQQHTVRSLVHAGCFPLYGKNMSHYHYDMSPHTIIYFVKLPGAQSCQLGLCCRPIRAKPGHKPLLPACLQIYIFDNKFSKAAATLQPLPIQLIFIYMIQSVCEGVKHRLR